MGSGGREHALALSLARTAEVVVAPGNPGMAPHSPEAADSAHFTLAGRPITVTADPEDVEAELFVIGPEQPLVDGLADRLRADRRLVLGPGADGARLEGSKAFMKAVLAEAGVPTARYGTFDEIRDAQEFLRELPGPWVVKTDGLAAGKGVLVTDSLDEAEADIAAKLSGEGFGDAGRRVVVEEGLGGPECSLLVLCDGTRIAALAPAQDFKRIGDDDTGPNTGGMGAYSPVPLVDDRLIDGVLDQAVEPLVGALRRRGIDYRGVLYAGLILTPDGPRCSSTTCASATPRPRSSCPGSPRTSPVCWPRRPPVACVPSRASRPRRRCAWCWPRRATPPPPVAATASTGWTRRPPSRASPCSTPAPPSTTKANSSLPGGASSG